MIKSLWCGPSLCSVGETLTEVMGQLRSIQEHVVSVNWCVGKNKGNRTGEKTIRAHFHPIRHGTCEQVVLRLCVVVLMQRWCG